MPSRYLCSGSNIWCKGADVPASSGRANSSVDRSHSIGLHFKFLQGQGYVNLLINDCRKRGSSLGLLMLRCRCRQSINRSMSSVPSEVEGSRAQIGKDGLTMGKKREADAVRALAGGYGKAL
jgi:hypothetical protein